MQQHNDKLQVDNAKLRQAAHGFQSDIVQLQQKQLETETEVRKQEFHKAEQLRLKNQELEDFVMKLKVGQSSRRTDKEAVEMAEQLKSILGFLVAKLGFRHRDVPNLVAAYLT